MLYVKTQTPVAASIYSGISLLEVKDVFSGKSSEGSNLLEISSLITETANQFLDREDHEQYNALRFFVEAGDEAFAAFFVALDDEAVSVISKYDDIAFRVKEFIRLRG